MIELVIASRCIDCDRCVKVCPTNVFDAVPGGHPVIARQSDCQTCFMCELYCPADALYVGPDCERPEAVDEEAILATDWPQQYRRDSGWGRDRDRHPNDVSFMQQMMPEALTIRASLHQRQSDTTRPDTARPDTTRPGDGDTEAPGT